MQSVFRLHTLADGVKGKVQCVDCRENYVYVGTREGTVVVYELNKMASASGETTFTAEHKGQVVHAKKRVIEKVQVLEAANKLAILCDGNVDFRALNTLEVPSALPTLPGCKDATNFCVTQREKSGYHICVITKRKMLLFKLDGNKAYQEHNLPETPQRLLWVKDKICMALRKQCVFVLEKEGSVQEVCPSSSQPLIARLTPKEVLVATGNNLGFSLDYDGQPAKRGTVKWSGDPLDVVAYLWFTVSLMPQGVEVHDMEDFSKPLQTMPVPNCIALARAGDRNIVLAAPTKLLLLSPVAFEEQIRELVAGKKVKESLMLFNRAKAKHLFRANRDNLRTLVCEMGFAFICECQFQEGVINIAESGADPRDLLSLFPDLFPRHDAYTPQCQATPRDKIHTIVRNWLRRLKKDIGDESVAPHVVRAEECTMIYLQRWRQTNQYAHGGEAEAEQFNEVLRVVDDALLVLYVKHNKEQNLEELITSEGTLVSLEANEVLLQKHSMCHVLALLYCKHKKFELALQVWLSVARGEKTDVHGKDGYDEIINFLKSSSDQRLIWTYSKFVLETNHAHAMSIFTNPDSPAGLHPDHVLEHLVQFNQQLTVQYLQHLVGTLHVTDAKYHTRLGLVHLDRVLQDAAANTIESPTLSRQLGLVGSMPHSKAALVSEAKAAGDGVDGLSPDAIALGSTSQSRAAGVRLTKLKQTPRGQLLMFLSSSQHYDVAQLLSRVHGTNLYEESVYLYSRAGRHSEALRTIAWVLKDEVWAQGYCMTQTPNITKYPEPPSKLLLLLLNIFLLVNEGAAPDPNKPDQPLEAEARRLLEVKGNEMDPAKVLMALPDSTSIAYLSSFLMRAIPHHHSQLREAALVKNLSKASLMNEKTELIRTHRKMVSIPENKTCGVCRKLMGNTVFAAYPNGVTVHYKCLADKNVCPVTGEVFTERC